MRISPSERRFSCGFYTFFFRMINFKFRQTHESYATDQSGAALNGQKLIKYFQVLNDSAGVL